MSTHPRLRVLGGVSASKGKKLHRIQYHLSSEEDVDQSDTLLHCNIYPPLYHLLLPTFLHGAVGREWLTTETKESINAAMKHWSSLGSDAKQKAPRDAKRSRDWITRRLTVLVHKYAIIQSILAPVRCCRPASPVCRDCWSPWLKCTKL